MKTGDIIKPKDHIKHLGKRPLVFTKILLKKIEKLGECTLDDFEVLNVKQDDWCYFWNDKNPDYKPIYQFDSFDVKRGKFISIDKNDENDLSWWDNCELVPSDLIGKTLNCM